jgi:hypothetical protein
VKPKILFVGLSVMIVGIIFTFFYYSEFSRISLAKQLIENLYKTLFPSTYQQLLQQNAEYQQLLPIYNRNLIMLIGGVAVLIAGLGITIYGTIKKEIISTLSAQTL